MVEVFDAHLAARAAPPRPEAPRADIPALAPVPFLAGPERLVSSLHVAQSLCRRHTGILRLLDILASERPDLLGAHLRFATYLHENGRPYRCFHLGRPVFDALMARLPCADLAAVALRDRTLAGWPDSPELPAHAALPAPAGAALDRDGLALMRIGGETVMIDTRRFEPGEAERAVLVTFAGDVLLDRAACHYPHQNWHGRRVGHVLTPTVEGGREVRAAGWVLGTVVEPRPAAEQGEPAGLPPRTGRQRLRLPAPRRRGLPALAATVVAGHA